MEVTGELKYCILFYNNYTAQVIILQLNINIQ